MACEATVSHNNTCAVMEKTVVRRRVYNGGPVRTGYRVAGIECVQCGSNDKPVELMKVSSIVEYSSGCSKHRGNCFGHMCITPTMNILPPQSLSFKSGDIRTQYYVASLRAFDGDTKKYIEEMKKTNYGKYGHLRSIMSTPVSGSARLVCVPHDNEADPETVYVSPNLASKIVFCCPQQNSSGIEGSVYEERSAREGDYVMLERAPSLSKYNNQPFKLAFWRKECLGIHPSVFSYFHGDYDGDEAHMYMLGTPASIDEASQWKPPLDKKLALASAYMSSTFPAEYGTSHGRGDLKFLEYTTLSFDQIGQRALSLPIGDYTRNKKDHLAMFADRIEKKPGTATFLADSIKGVKDIMRQQVSQGKIGDMSRVARISAMCFVRGRSGGTYVIGRNSRVLLNRNTAPSTGCPAVRCIMVLCQASQQAALDAHRVGSTQSTGIDMIADMLNGRLDTGENVARSTLYCFSGMGVAEVKQDLGCTFCCRVDDVVIAVAPDDAGSAPVMKHLVAAYSPVVLSRVPVGARRGTCKKGITVVLNYYSLRLENDDIEDLVEAMSYRVQASRYPITTREGMLKRGLGWMETLMACDYTKLPLLAGSASGALSATSATMCANFASL